MRWHGIRTEADEHADSSEMSDSALELAAIGCLAGIVLLLAAAMAGLWMRLPA